MTIRSLLFISLLTVGCSDDISQDSKEVTDSDASADVGASDMGLDASPEPSDLGTDVGDEPDAAEPDMAATDMGTDAADQGEPDMAPPAASCDPDGLAPGTYDPDCVYLLGTLLPGSAGTDVFTYPGSGEIHYGFGSYAKFPVIRPTDGSLIFGDFDTWHIFEPDAVRMPGDARPDYPSEPLANDTLVTGPACDMIGFGIYKVLVFPDDGALAYACFNDNAKLYAGGTLDYLGVSAENTVALGADRRILVDRTDGAFIVESGVETEVTGLRAFERIIAARWLGGRFVAAVFHEYRPRDIEMWSIEPDGTATSLGVVQLSDAIESYFQGCVLDGFGDLHCFATAAGTLQDRIVVYRTNEDPETIFTEPEESVSIHISELATGP